MNTANCHMREALTPEQVPKMLEFLTSLSELSKFAPEPDVGAFVNKYREIKTGYTYNLGNKHKRGKKPKVIMMCLCCGAKFKRDNKNPLKIYCNYSCSTKHRNAVYGAERQGVK